MARDPRCEWLNEKSAKYRALSERVIEKLLLSCCRAHGVAPLCVSDFRFLWAVANAKEQDVSMARIARVLGVNPSSATRRNRRLLECALVTNVQDEKDERRYNIALTQAGRAFYEDMDATLLEATRRMYSTVTEEEMNAVFRFTEKCIENLELMLEDE